MITRRRDPPSHHPWGEDPHTACRRGAHPNNGLGGPKPKVLLAALAWLALGCQTPATKARPQKILSASCRLPQKVEPAPTHLNHKAAAQEFRRGLALAKEGDHIDAIAAFTTALRLDPRYGIAHLSKAESHLYTDNDQSKIGTHLERAVHLLPGNPRARLLYGDHTLELGDQATAERQWRCALELKPGFTDAHLRLARTFFEASNYHASEQELRRALKTAPEHAQVHVLLADVLIATGRTLDAAKHVESAARIVARSAALYRRAADLFAAAGDAKSKPLRAIADQLDPPPAKRKMRDLRPRRNRAHKPHRAPAKNQ